MMSILLIILLIIIACAFLGYGIVWMQRAQGDKAFLSYYLHNFVMITTILLVIGRYGHVESALVNSAALYFYVACLMTPPLLYIYLRSIYSINVSLTWPKLAWHFIIPALLLLINVFSFVYLTTSSESSDYYSFVSSVMNYGNFIALTFVFFVQNCFYLIGCYRIYLQHKRDREEIYSDSHAVKSNWMLMIISGYLILIASIYLSMSGIVPGGKLIVVIVFLSYLLYIAYKGYARPSFSTIINELRSDEVMDIDLVADGLGKTEETEFKLSQRLQSNKPIDDIKKNLLTTELESCIKIKKPYLHPKLTIFDLSRMVGTNSKYLRYVIKHEYKVNFATYINQLRVKEAQKNLMELDNTQFTIEYIAEISGFKSRSSFHTIFKKLTSMTPNAYRQNHLTSNQERKIIHPI